VILRRIKAITVVAASIGGLLLSAGTAHAQSVSLKGVCPSKIVIQTDWFATPERAAAYQLVGPNGTVDAKNGT
jgi:hypothetical protein